MNIKFRITFWIPMLGCLLASHFLSAQEKQQEPKKPAEVEQAKLGSTVNVHQCGNLFLAGQFASDDIKLFKEQEVARVITLRTDGEIDWDEESALKDAEIEFHKFPFRGPDALTDEVFDKVRQLLSDQETRTVFHCGSANRVGGVWLAYRVLDEGVELESAIEEAKTIGLRTEGYLDKARDYIERKLEERDNQSETSVNPGINDDFLNSELDVEAFVERFEVESREIYTHRLEILKACNITSESRVADIGAGTGLFTRLFSIGAKHGWVYAIDISTRFIEHINLEAEKYDLENITGVLCSEDSINLPPDSIDLAFICDTYHHFEYPQSTLASIYRALDSDGHLIVIDFERIPGVTREWLLKHVRAGKDEFRAEIEQAGFSFVEEIEIAGLHENYCLKFKK